MAFPSDPGDYDAFCEAMHVGLEKLRKQTFPDWAREETLKLTINSKSQFEGFVRRALADSAS